MENTFTETWHSSQRELTRPHCEGSSPAPGWVTGRAPLIRSCQQGEIPRLHSLHPPGGWTHIPVPGSRLFRVTLENPYSHQPPQSGPPSPLWQISWTIAAVSTRPTNARSWTSMQSSGATCNLCVVVYEINFHKLLFFLVYCSAFLYCWWLIKQLAGKKKTVAKKLKSNPLSWQS